MRVAILGYGVEGKAAAKYWSNLGHQICVRDAQPELQIPEKLESRLGPDYLENLDQYDLIVRTPSVHPGATFKANPNLDTAKITSVINEFMAQCPAKIIGVTGTKGKGTTASLIAAMLKEAGHNVHLGGNIGRPPLDFLSDVNPEDWVVLELSSFQLMDLRRSPHVAVMLMIASDHLNWHADMPEYLAAKQAIFAHQGPGDRAIFNACNIYSLQSGLGAPGDQIPFNAQQGGWIDGDQVKIGKTHICRTDDISLPGRHNWDNIAAALTAVWPIIQDPKPIKQAIQSFQGLEHRLEKVDEINGVTYINDSYSSSSGPTIAAIRAFDQPKILILGGYDKGIKYEPVAREIASSNVRHVIVIGAISHQITHALDKVGYTHYSLGPSKMSDIVALAAKQAKPGDVVILSPGTSSFDMFKNFKERGEHFKAAVHDLEKPA